MSFLKKKKKIDVLNFRQACLGQTFFGNAFFETRAYCSWLHHHYRVYQVDQTLFFFVLCSSVPWPKRLCAGEAPGVDTMYYLPCLHIMSTWICSQWLILCTGALVLDIWTCTCMFCSLFSFRQLVYYTFILVSSPPEQSSTPECSHNLIQEWSGRVFWYARVWHHCANGQLLHDLCEVLHEIVHSGRIFLHMHLHVSTGSRFLHL